MHIQGDRERDRHRPFRLAARRYPQLAAHSPPIRPPAGQLRSQEALDPLGSINNRILATCLGSGDLPEPLEMTLTERVEFLNRAEAGRHPVTADARCEFLGCPKSVNQLESSWGLRSLSFLKVTDDRQVEQIADFVESRRIRVRQSVKSLVKDGSHFRFSVFEYPQGSWRRFPQLQVLTENLFPGLTVNAHQFSTIVEVPDVSQPL